MKMRKVLVILAVLVTLAIGVLSPTPARANSTTNALVIAGAVAAAYVAIVLVATAAVNRHRPLGLAAPVDPPPADSTARQPRVAFGPHCPPSNGNATLLCW